MSLGILNDLKSVPKLVEFLVAQNINFIAYLDRAFNSRSEERRVGKEC